MNRMVLFGGAAALLAIVLSNCHIGIDVDNESAPTIVPGSGKFFDSVAPNYDLMNRIISLGLDKGWRREAISKAMPADSLLDVSTGTADLAIAVAANRSIRVVGIDPSEEMLARGRDKLSRAGDVLDNLELIAGVAEDLPFESETFDAVVVAFGVRNFQDRAKGLREMARVLKINGRLVVLELSAREGTDISSRAHRFFVNWVMPRIASIVTGNRLAYQYLSSSMHSFPGPKKFMSMLREAGLAETGHSRLYPFQLGPDLYTAVKRQDLTSGE